MISVTKFALLTPGCSYEIKNLFRLGEVLALFDNETQAKEWLKLQLVENPDYFKVVPVVISMDARLADSNEVKLVKDSK